MVAALLAVSMAGPSNAEPSVACVQDELTNLGFQPGPVDGALGGRSRAAANAFVSRTGIALPNLTDESAVLWCAEIKSFAKSPAAQIMRSRAAQLLPNDVLLDFAKSDPGRRARFCKATTAISALGRIEPVTKIKGFSSRQRTAKGPDSKFVPGARDVERFAQGFGGLAVHALAANNDQLKGELLDVLQKWANAGAFLDTYLCKVNSRKCTQWTVPDGSDLSRVKDWEFAVNHASGLIRAYYITLADFQADQRQQQHDDIIAWIASIGKMLKRADDIPQVYFLGEVFWPVIVNDYARGSTSAAHNKLRQIEHALDRAVFAADGSIKKATTRGDRALWYHFYGLSMVVPSMEMIRAAGIPISDRVEKRLHKAVALFLAALDEPEILDPWARTQRNSTYDGSQDFELSGWMNFNGGGSWVHIYPYRYPDREEAVQLRDRASATSRSATSDVFFGLGLGCLYNAAADYRQSIVD